MRIHFGSLASNNGFQIKMRLYKIHAYWVEHIESGVGCRDGGGLVMAVERCRPWRGVFLVFCIAPKGATTKAVVAANR